MTLIRKAETWFTIA